MVDIYRVQTVLTGVAGSPWYSNLFFSADGVDPQACATRVRGYWLLLAPQIGLGVTAQVNAETLQLDDATGEVVAGHPTPQAVATMTGTGEVLPPATQGLIKFKTLQVRNGRRVQGRSFIPWMLESNNANGGVPTSTFLNAAQAAGDHLQLNVPTPFGVWRRPVSGAGGEYVTCTATIPWAKWAVLRSRRD